jgi:hypothetical protein
MFEILFQNSEFSAEGQEYIKFICKSIVVGNGVTESMSHMAISAMKMVLKTDSGNSLVDTLKADIITNLVSSVIESESEEFFELILFIIT